MSYAIICWKAKDWFYLYEGSLTCYLFVELQTKVLWFEDLYSMNCFPMHSFFLLICYMLCWCSAVNFYWIPFWIVSKSIKLREEKCRWDIKPSDNHTWLYTSWADIFHWITICYLYLNVWVLLYTFVAWKVDASINRGDFYACLRIAMKLFANQLHHFFSISS